MCNFSNMDMFPKRCVWINGPLIVGAGPSGLAVAAILKEQVVPYTVLERSDCIASLWQKRTYDRLKLHLPKQFCQLPNFPFPDHYPEYPSKRQFIEYLESYAKHFDINPQFNECVQSAKYEEGCNPWRVKTVGVNGSDEVEYICQWIVVASGKNAERVVPEIDCFEGEVIHVCDYKSGEKYSGKNVLVVGCGNSGMEVSFDLCNYEAKLSMVVRSADGVILGADTRDTEGPIVADIVADKDREKIHKITRNIYCCGAGTAADTEAVTGNSICCY